MNLELYNLLSFLFRQALVFHICIWFCVSYVCVQLFSVFVRVLQIPPEKNHFEVDIQAEKKHFISTFSHFQVFVKLRFYPLHLFHHIEAWSHNNWSRHELGHVQNI